jgi:hypothetical protein
LKDVLIDVAENFYLRDNIGDSVDTEAGIWKILIDNMTSEKRYLINDIFIKLELAKYISKIKNNLYLINYYNILYYYYFNFF